MVQELTFWTSSLCSTCSAFIAARNGYTSFVLNRPDRSVCRLRNEESPDSSAARKMLSLRAVSRSCRGGLAPLLARAQSSTTAVAPTVKATENSLPLPHEKYTDSTPWEKHQEYIRHGEPNMRTYNYMLMGGARLMGASASRLLLIKFLAQMNPSADVLALANVEVDVSNLDVGKSMTVKWRGKPVFVRRRTEEEIAEANSVNLAELRDPQADADRVRAEPEWLVLLGVCTHLGCVPIPNAGDYGGWFCPCHGSHYDISGRIRKGPAPYNMEVSALLGRSSLCSYSVL